MTNGVPSAGGCPATATMHILVVDDDPGIRGFIQMTLHSEGYEVATAANGRLALDRIAEQRPDVILLDLSMPVMTGWQLNDWLREHDLNIPVIFMTAGFSARMEAERHQVAGYLAKPLDVDDLLRMVARFRPDRRS